MGTCTGYLKLFSAILTFGIGFLFLYKFSALYRFFAVRFAVFFKKRRIEDIAQKFMQEGISFRVQKNVFYIDSGIRVIVWGSSTDILVDGQSSKLPEILYGIEEVGKVEIFNMGMAVILKNDTSSQIIVNVLQTINENC